MTPKQFNDWRIVPRLLMGGAWLFTGYAWLLVFNWFVGVDWKAIDNEFIALALAGFPAIILGVLTTNVSTLTNNYFRTGGTNGGNGG